MDNRAVIHCILTCSLCLIPSANVVGITPSVRGTVVDADGKPVSHAYIEARPLPSKFTTGTVVGNSPNPWVAADQFGHFEIQLGTGQYRIRGKDEQDGFPDPTFCLNTDPKARFPEITVNNEDVTGIEVVLGGRGGILTGSVQDAGTHAPVADAKVRLQDAHNSQAYVDIFTNSAGQFQYTVPSKPIVISVSAAGYKPAAPRAGGEIILKPGEPRQIDIELTRE